MNVQKLEVGQGERRRPPVANGPIAELLRGADDAARSLFVSLAGEARLSEAGAADAQVELQPGVLATIPPGRRWCWRTPARTRRACSRS